MGNMRYSAWIFYFNWANIASLNPMICLSSTFFSQSKNDIDGALNKYKLVEVEHQLGPEIWNNVGLCFFKKRKFIAVNEIQSESELNQSSYFVTIKGFVWFSFLYFRSPYRAWRNPYGFRQAILCVCIIWVWYFWPLSNMPAHFIHWLQPARCDRKTQNVSCYLEVSHTLNYPNKENNDAKFHFLVCLRHLNDHANAFLAFERSTMLIDAIKNPLIYLNFSIFCWKTNRIEMAQSNLRNFYQLSDNIGVRLEVIHLWFMISLMNLNWLPFYSIKYWRQLSKNNYHSLAMQQTQL